MADARLDAAIQGCPGDGPKLFAAGRIQAGGRTANLRLVVAASSAGTIFEWYDFVIYGVLAPMIGQTFFPAGNPTLQTLLVWAGFAAGFGFRPLGAILFGYLGDRYGRKYTFLVTVSLMGIATAGIGLIPAAADIGIAAPIIVVTLRILQGLAMGGEHGGAITFVAEHAPPHSRGFFTSFIQAASAGGLVLSLFVVLVCKQAMDVETWTEWGWRVPFLLSFGLLAISLWIRLKLSESPVFRAMKEEGQLSRNPLVECFTYPGNKGRLFVALFGVSAGLAVLAYTTNFVTLSFLQSAMHMDDMYAELIVAFSGVAIIAFTILFGKLSDRVGRKTPIVWAYALTLVLLFPTFWIVGAYANPGLAAAAHRSPVVITGPDCSYNPFKSEQPTPCTKLLSDLSGTGIAFMHKEAANLTITVGGKPISLKNYSWADKAMRGKQLQAWLRDAGYDFGKVRPSLKDLLVILATRLVVAALLGAIFGAAPALLAEMFPPRIRYSSMSIPYHIGNGYFGGFLPLVAAYIVAKTGDPFAGLWYTWIIVAISLVVVLWGLQRNGAAQPQYT